MNKIAKYYSFGASSVSTTSTSYNATSVLPGGDIRIDVSKFSDATYYFEAVLWSSGVGITAYCRLNNVTDDNFVVDSEVSTTSTNPVRVRSSAITLSGSKRYGQGYKTSSGASYIHSPKVVIIQEADLISSTQTNINKILYQATNAVDYHEITQYPSAFEFGNNDGTIITNFEVLIESEPGGKVYVGLFDMDTDLIVPGTNLGTTESSPTWVTSGNITLIAGHRYIVKMRVINSTYIGYAHAWNLYITQTGNWTKTNTFIPFGSYNFLHATTYNYLPSDNRVILNMADFDIAPGNLDSYFYCHFYRTGATATGYARLYDTSIGAEISGSEISETRLWNHDIILKKSSNLGLIDADDNSYIRKEGKYADFSVYIGPSFLMIEAELEQTLTSERDNDCIIAGMDTSEVDRDAVSFGQVESYGDRDAVLHGLSEDQTNLDCRVWGKTSSERDTDCVVSGQEDIESVSRSCRLWGQDTSTHTSVSAILGGELEGVVRSCVIDGKGDGTDSGGDRDCVIYGQVESEADRDCVLWGRYPGTDSERDNDCVLEGMFDTYKTINCFMDADTTYTSHTERSCYMDSEENNITDYIKPNRNGRISLGFGSEYCEVFNGVSQLPKSSLRNKTTAIHFYDKMEYLRNYKLPEGSLNININTADYVKAILIECGFTLADMDFDAGIQTIPVAWYGGNTALYEIEQVVEAEGGRFFVREDGKFIFENRQHYNVNDEYQNASWIFDFDNSVDIEYPSDESSIVNKVTIEVEPRVQQSSGDIWTYGETPKLMSGESITIWARLEDPANPITTPVSTTDYTANSESDGSGTDRTSDISISTTTFAQAVKMVVTNTGAYDVYLTLLKLRGQSYSKQNKVKVYYDDTVSQGLYGTKELTLTNKYFQDTDFAESFAQLIVLRYKNPLHRIILNNRCVPQLQLGDMVSVRNEEISKTYLMRVVKIKMSIGHNGMNQELSLREITTDELANYFTIGSSEIEGPDVIAP